MVSNGLVGFEMVLAGFKRSILIFVLYNLPEVKKLKGQMQKTTHERIKNVMVLNLSFIFLKNYWDDNQPFTWPSDS